MEKIKVGYVGFSIDCQRLQYDNSELDIIHINESSKLIGRDFHVIIKGYGWETIGNYATNELVFQKKMEFAYKYHKMKFAYKHPFRFWLSKIFKRRK